jgi:DNA-binding CsgD family transcriptional regulator/flagellar basal body-associated protein FliL
MILLALPNLYADNIKDLTTRLEQELNSRQKYLHAKEQRIDSLSMVLQHTANANRKMELYELLFNEFLTYKADSVINCVNREMVAADATANPDHIAAAKIHKSLAYATTGYFSHADELLNEIDCSVLADTVKAEYYTAREWIYGVWAEYTDDATFTPQFRNKRVLYLDSIISVLPEGSLRKKYVVAERHLRLHQYKEALPLYDEVLRESPENTRLYAQSAYAAAMIFERQKDWEHYEEYLLKAAISDQVTPLKENLALQQLALFINKKYDDLDRANRYLLYSLEDAYFYNNRLRLIEIAKKFPDIIVSYQQKMVKRNDNMNIALWVIIVLCVVLAVNMFLLYKKWKADRQHIRDIAEANAKLEEMNMRLIDTNAMREQYVYLFMDLCATYIDKFNKYRSTVKAKVKARLQDDLLKPALARNSEAESRELFFNFDKAFLHVFPDFVEEFNKLLREGEKIELKPNEQLNTELRIFAMVRMGIKDSSKIATLLFYSPQTIYNYRTAVRNRAINRDTFEAEVERLCLLNNTENEDSK